MNELYENELDIHDALEVLESGYNCRRSKRAKGTIEKCLDIKRKTIKVVVAKSFDYHSDSEVWVITHVGITSKRKARK
jgi:hypothetical protein